MRSSEPSILPWAVCILRNENVDLKSPWQTFSNLSMLVVATIHRLQVSRSSCCGLVWIGLSVSGGHGLSFREPLVYTALHENIKLFQYAKILLKCKRKLWVFFFSGWWDTVIDRHAGFEGQKKLEIEPLTRWLITADSLNSTSASPAS